MNPPLRRSFPRSTAASDNSRAQAPVLPRSALAILTLAAFLFILRPCAFGQSLGSAGTIGGTVTDATGAPIVDARVSLSNDLTLYRREAITSASGEFHFTNVPPNAYRFQVDAPGFQPDRRDLTVRSSVPVSVEVRMAIEAQQTSVTVTAEETPLETTPSAHSDVDNRLFSKMPLTSIASGLSDVVTLSSPAVVADSDGFFHSLGDHAQMSFSIDGQPITDQQGSLFSTQIPLNAIQSIEAMYGGVPAEYGDKTSLVVTTVTRSGLGQKPQGSLSAEYGSFETANLRGDLGFGGKTWGLFLAVNGSRSNRFLDTPESTPLHGNGNGRDVFVRADYQPRSSDAFHLNIITARNWFQVPNTYPQEASGQDQRQKVRSYNIAPGWVHVFGPTSLLSMNAFLRQDQVNYYPSSDPMADQPGTLAQDRTLTNLGLKSDFSFVRGRHNAKVGAQVTRTRLTENFTLGLTDPTFNPVCLDADGNPVTDPALRAPEMCLGAGYQANPDLLPGLVPYDLTRGGSLFDYHGQADIKQLALYAQDAITLGHWTVNAGLRFDRYDGISRGSQLQPRLSASYYSVRTGTVLRAAYSHTYETPLNENLVLSSATGEGGLAENVFGAYASVPLQPGIRNMYDVGFQQALGSHLVLDAEYFWKYTQNAFDLDNLFTTAIFFPIEWDHSKMDGLAARLSLRQYKGLSGFVTLGHTRARVFGPENGGLIFGSPVDRSVVRIDHDQALQSTTHVQYQFGRNGPWLAVTWRYDSGIVSGAIPDLASVLGLTADQQWQIRFYCGDQVATPTKRIASCDSANWGAPLVRIPAEGTANDDKNPARVSPRNLFNIGVGTDNLLHRDNVRLTLRLEALNVTNELALFNFLSTCAGTHYVPPRSYRAELGVAF